MLVEAVAGDVVELTAGVAAEEGVAMMEDAAEEGAGVGEGGVGTEAVDEVEEGEDTTLITERFSLEFDLNCLDLIFLMMLLYINI